MADADRLRKLLDRAASVALVAFAIVLSIEFIRPWIGSRSVQPPELPSAPIVIDLARTEGSTKAKVALVEYVDFECPYCAQFAKAVLPALRDEYIEPGRILFSVRDLPLTGIHPWAEGAAVAAGCAAQQGKFTQLYPMLFDAPSALTPNDIAHKAKQAGLDMQQFSSCLVDDKASALVRDDSIGAAVLRIATTPTFLLGSIGDDGRVKVSRIIVGTRAYTDFKSIIDLTIAGGRIP